MLAGNPRRPADRCRSGSPGRHCKSPAGAWRRNLLDFSPTVTGRKEENAMALLNVVIDLSHHNTVTSFHEAQAAAILGVIHKATEGSSFVDASYNERRARALSIGLFWGAYHFGVRGNVRAQADHFLEITNPGPTDLLVLDFEPNPRE